MPDFAEIQKWVMSYDAHRDPNQKVLAYSYMAHLRHNGFPSPLLDWTRSPYVAAFFAFSKPQSDEVAIYGFAESPNNSKFGSSTEPQIQLLGQYVKTPGDTSDSSQDTRSVLSSMRQMAGNLFRMMTCLT
jgi:hypothetical protein